MERTPLPFLHEIEKLKHLPRTGWLRTIAHPESVAAHSHRVAILALLAPVNSTSQSFWSILANFFRMIRRWTDRNV